MTVDVIEFEPSIVGFHVNPEIIHKGDIQFMFKDDLKEIEINSVNNIEAINNTYGGAVFALLGLFAVGVIIGCISFAFLKQRARKIMDELKLNRPALL